MNNISDEDFYTITLKKVLIKGLMRDAFTSTADEINKRIDEIDSDNEVRDAQIAHVWKG